MSSAAERRARMLANVRAQSNRRNGVPSWDAIDLTGEQDEPSPRRRPQASTSRHVINVDELSSPRSAWPPARGQKRPAPPKNEVIDVEAHAAATLVASTSTSTNSFIDLGTVHCVTKGASYYAGAAHSALGPLHIPCGECSHRSQLHRNVISTSNDSRATLSTRTLSWSRSATSPLLIVRPSPSLSNSS